MQLPQGSHKVIDPGCSKPAVCVTERVSSSVVLSKLQNLTVPCFPVRYAPWGLKKATEGSHFDTGGFQP